MTAASPLGTLTLPGIDDGVLAVVVLTPGPAGIIARFGERRATVPLPRRDVARSLRLLADTVEAVADDLDAVALGVG